MFFMARDDEKKEKQVGVWLAPLDQALFVAIAEDDDRPAGQLGRRILLDWMEEWFKKNPGRAPAIREIAKLKLEKGDDGGSDKSGARTRVKRTSR